MDTLRPNIGQRDSGFKENKEKNEIKKRLIDMTNQAYEKVAALRKMNAADVFKKGTCIVVCEELLPLVKEIAPNAQIYEYPGGWVVTEHDYINAEIDKEEWVIDGTWQQFLREEIRSVEKFPSVLIVKKTAEDIESELQKWGVKPEDFSDSIRETHVKLMKKRFADIYLEADPIK